MKTVRFVLSSVSAVSCVLAVALMFSACGGGGGGAGPPGGGGGTGGGSGDSGIGGAGAGGIGPTGVCLLNNCSSDAQCDGCSFGRTKCDVANTRCVACDAKSGSGCAKGEKCTSFGTCAPEDKTCPTDSGGEPTITCTGDIDCAACDPAHQVCLSGKCTGCSIVNGEHCLGSDTCTSEGKCAPKCPGSCTVDSDCGTCDLGGKTAKACYNHVCSECSDTSPCPQGFECQKGACVKPCGVQGPPGSPVGGCKTDAECYGCGNYEGTEKWVCKMPVNGTHGTCSHPAAGCSELGGATLPPPFDKVTNTCSVDGDCANVSADLNVGKLIRDVIGDDKILGVKIGDANIQYPMNSCASVELFNEKKCGLCVPCKTDADCKPIPLDPVIQDLFKSSPLASIAAAFLMDKLFGKDNHQLHMQCQPVAGGFGACLPCTNPTKGCGAGSITGPIGSGKCDHDACTTGTALDPTCGICATAVCLADPYCCTDSWDDLCITVANIVCPVGCNGVPKCAHNPCKTGTPLNPACSPCVKTICEQDAYCCSGGWEQSCVDKANALTECTEPCGGGSACSHKECDIGTALPSTCSNCAAEVCKIDPYCCTQEWDKICANNAKDNQACACN